ncbi:MAG: ATP-grasp domain-containing protein [Polaromonas sp.]
MEYDSKAIAYWSGIVKVFICDHACAAIPLTGTLNSSAGFHGEFLLQALLADITLVSALYVSILRDPKLRPIDLPTSSVFVPFTLTNAIDLIDGCIQDADAIWPLAPESNGVLEAISRRVLQHHKVLLGSTPAAVHLTGSKYRTSQALRAAGVSAVPTYRPNANLQSDFQGWVVKPDDGAGCSDTRIFSHSNAAREWIAAQLKGDYVLQPYLSGRPCSLSLLCGSNDAFLLGCDDQRIAVSDNQFHHMGSTVNAMDDNSGELRQLAHQVNSAIPGLWGYVGIDFIFTKQGPVVLEVNPRMTLSHAGIHASIGANPAEMLIDMLRTGHCELPMSHIKRRQISVDVNAWLHRNPAQTPLAR